MLKIYLSGPMTGLPDMNFPAFNNMAEQLEGIAKRIRKNYP
jgi:hypothetical protein